MIAAIDLILEAQNAVIITKIQWIVGVGVLNGKVKCLSAGVLDAGSLLLSTAKGSLENTLLAVIALAGSLDVPACTSLVLPGICFQISVSLLVYEN